MEEVGEFCERVLGHGSHASEAASEALSVGAADRLSMLAAASRACRTRGSPTEPPAAEHVAPAEGMAQAVARELAAAAWRLPERQREALALREHARLSYEQISEVMGIGPAAVAPLLARARLRFREERRGVSESSAGACTERDRALRALAERQDSETTGAVEADWLIGHLCACEPCSQAHAAMLEASVCYRAWSVADSRPEQSIEEMGPELAQPEEQPATELHPLGASESAPPLDVKSGWWTRFRAALAADARR